MTKAFRVAAVSINRNSFGLRGMILVAEDAEAWQVAANDLHLKPKRSVLNVPLIRGECDFTGFGFEIPERMPNAPEAVVRDIWDDLYEREN